MNSFNVVSLSSMNEMALLSDWIKHHTFTFVFCHIFLMLAIYIYWGVTVDRFARKSPFFAENHQKIKLVHWVVMSVIAVIDWIVFY
jgi:hypothetical protein